MEFLFEDPAIVANVYLLQWMSLIVLFVGLSLLFTNLYAPARKLFRQRLKVMVYAMFFNLILGFLLVPYIGLRGTVITTILTELFLVIISARFYFTDKERRLTSTI